ncbi:bifunctional adenosylcobinamide kinase/adenosylcobinamide-phosphate guanylyltransferase [Piscinibacter sp.]|uniref:bifunctional adenosylcobinamide kinase/adenosylcobinamide-phosphate guanylyltransferase n=1 Tax=Piscinibacter sp. TaxID=1903157 RepID=UPI0039E3FBE8
MVSNEIGWGVMPVSREVRAVVDALGLLHQAVAERCARVTLMVAGVEWPVKGPR